HVFLLAGLFVVPGAGLQASLNVDLAALLQVFARDLSQALPQHDVVPLGAILPFARFVLEALIGSDGELGHRSTLRRVFDFRILSQIADQLNPVETFSSHVGAPSLRFTIAESGRWISGSDPQFASGVSFWAALSGLLVQQ